MHCPKDSTERLLLSFRICIGIDTRLPTCFQLNNHFKSLSLSFGYWLWVDGPYLRHQDLVVIVFYHQYSCFISLSLSRKLSIGRFTFNNIEGNSGSSIFMSFLRVKSRGMCFLKYYRESWLIGIGYNFKIEQPMSQEDLYSSVHIPSLV